MAGRPDPFTRSTELEAIIHRWIETYSGVDAGLLADLFSRSAAACYMGSAPGELWQGDALRRLFPAYTEEIPRYEFEVQRLEAYQHNDTGWGFWSGIVRPIGTGSAGVVFRATYVFILEGAQWRLAHVHNSTPVPNVEALGYDTKRFDALVAAASDDATVDLGVTGIATVMFTDIADSTALAEVMGDGRWANIVSNHLDHIRGFVEGAGGRLVKSLGDGTLSTFPSASAALNCARDIQRAAAQTAEPRLRIRIGIHTGDVVEAGGDYVGTVVNKAARVATTAAPDEIRVSEATRVMVGGNTFRFSDPVNVPLKGLDGDHLIHRLDWAA